MKIRTSLVLALLALLLLVPSVWAVSISAPTQISAFSAWSFKTQFELLDLFDSAQLWVDNQLVAKLYPASNNQTFPDPLNGHLLLAAHFLDKKWFITLNGLEAGSHSIRVETLSGGGEVVASESAMVSFVLPLPENAQSDFEQKLSQLKSENQLLEQKTSELEQQKNALEEKVQRQEQELSGQRTQLEQLTDTANSFQQNLSGLVAFNESVAQQLQTLSAKQNPAPDSLGSGFSGLVSGAQNSGGILVALAVLVVLCLAGFFVFQQWKKSRVY